MALLLFASAIALFVMSMYLSSKPGLASIARGMRVASPWCLFFGALLLFLYWMLHRRTNDRVPPVDPIVFGESTTTFQQPTLEEEQSRSITLAGHRPPKQQETDS